MGYLDNKQGGNGGGGGGGLPSGYPASPEDFSFNAYRLGAFGADQAMGSNTLPYPVTDGMALVYYSGGWRWDNAGDTVIASEFGEVTELSISDIDLDSVLYGYRLRVAFAVSDGQNGTIPYLRLNEDARQVYNWRADGTVNGTKVITSTNDENETSYIRLAGGAGQFTNRQNAWIMDILINKIPSDGTSFGGVYVQAQTSGFTSIQASMQVANVAGIYYPDGAFNASTAITGITIGNRSGLVMRQGNYRLTKA